MLEDTTAAAAVQAAAAVKVINFYLFGCTTEQVYTLYTGTVILLAIIAHTSVIYLSSVNDNFILRICSHHLTE